MEITAKGYALDVQARVSDTEIAAAVHQSSSAARTHALAVTAKKDQIEMEAES